MRGYKYYAENANTTERHFTHHIQKIKYISNDGDISMFVGFNLRRDVVSVSGKGDEIEIKAGEVLNDIDIDTNRIYFRTETGFTPFRMLVMT